MGGEAAVKQAGGELIFSLPSLPPSMNSLYQIIYSQRRIEMKPEVRLWKSRAKGFIPVWPIAEGEELDLEFRMEGNWLYKNGKPKRMDVQNLLKVVIDALCEKWGVDDSRVREIRAVRVQGEMERVVIAARRVKVG